MPFIQNTLYFSYINKNGIRIVFSIKESALTVNNNRNRMIMVIHEGGFGA